MTEFEAKVAVVFAASRGIGKAVAARLARGGASVLVNYATNRAKGDEAVRAIEAAGG